MKKYYTGEINLTPNDDNLVMVDPSMIIKAVYYDWVTNETKVYALFENAQLGKNMRIYVLANDGVDRTSTDIEALVASHEILGLFE